MLFGLIAIAGAVAYGISIAGPATTHKSLEAYIMAGNPQSADDIDRLEREYFSKKQMSNLF
jgi:hypothetical protein